MVDWNQYPNCKPVIPGLYLISYYGPDHINFRESYWNGKEFDSKEVQYWANINWPKK